MLKQLLKKKPQIKEVVPVEKKPLEKLWGMTSPQERDFVVQYCQDHFSGEGEVVDLGSWFGSLTAAALLGLKQNPNSPAGNLWAYDLFKWQEWMRIAVSQQKFMPNPSIQDSLLPVFLEQVLPYDTQGRLIIQAGDLTKIGWCGKPIEFLIVDAMKSWELANSILKDFYSALIPGKSVVFHQDFSFYSVSWIHLIQYQLRDYFEPLKDIEASCGFAFTNTKKIPDEILRKGVWIEDFSVREIDLAFDYVEGLLINKTPFKCSSLRTSRLLAYVEAGCADNAIQKANELFDAKLILEPHYESLIEFANQK